MTVVNVNTKLHKKVISKNIKCQYHKRNQEGDQGGPWTPLEGADLKSESAKKDFRRSKNARLRLD